MKSMRKSLVMGVLALTVGGLAGCGGKTDLKLVLKKGDARTVSSTESNKITMSIQGMNMEIGQTQELRLRFDVQDVAPDGLGSVKTTFERSDFGQYMSMGGTTMPGMDAMLGGGLDKALEKAYGALEGQSFTMKLGSDGKVRGAEGVEALTKKMVDSIELPAGPMSAMIKPMLQAQLSKAVTNQSTETSLTAQFAIYPAGPVRVNDSWTFDTEVAGQFPMKISRTAVLKSMDAVTAIIELKSSITGNLDGLTELAGPIKGKLDLKGDETGTLNLELATGWIKRADLTQKVSGTLELQAGGMIPPGMSSGIPITVERKILLETYPAS